jgi:redox-sensitive bicupin YhaK (pirin superfamily)
MIEVRPSEERGRARLDWLDSRFTFSFDQYYDPRHMGFGHLRVLNDDWIAPGGGFPMHPHRDMEIITYVLEGALQHKDSLGNGSVIRPGEIQRMSAGTGIVHSEFNPSGAERTHLLQIWIRPRLRGAAPSYEQKAIDLSGPGWRRIASPDGRDGSVTVQQNVEVFAARPAAGERLAHRLARGRLAWIQVASGALTLNGVELRTGDGAGIRSETELVIEAREASELLLFDMSA